MKKAGLCWLLLLLGAKAQGFWIERSEEWATQPLQAMAYQIAPQKWAVVASLALEEWLPYAFDTTIAVRFQLADEKAIVAETTLSLSARSHWQGYFFWQLPEKLKKNAFFLIATPTEGPESKYATWLFWPEAITPLWIEQATPFLGDSVRLHWGEGPARLSRRGDSLWQKAFRPALVDTSLPLPPYVLKKPKKTQKVFSPCAWYLGGDTSRIFWSCVWPGRPYPAPGASFPAPPQSVGKEAFFRFSDIKPGERTDRGLVFLFLGMPSVRLRSPTQEIWVYPEREVSFYFSFSGGTWVLSRRLEYQALWKK